MPIKNDETGKRWVEIETFVPGTPEQVWQAIATGPGVAAWYVRAQIDGHVGGKVVLDFGAKGTATGEVTVWEPPRRFGYVEREWSEGAPPLATELTVAGRSGARCVIRLVHSLFASTNDWDDQLEDYESGWPGFFEVLRLYLAHFTGAQAACFHLMGTVKGDQPETWKRLTELLGVSGANVGDRWKAERPQAMSGRVSRLQQGPEERYVMLLLEKPRTGIAQIGTYGVPDAPETNIGIGLYFYGDEAGQQAASSEPIWQSWFAETFKPSRCGPTANGEDFQGGRDLRP
jgi:uncharacterized protein YndB with AHSA1/START domain